MRRVGLVAMATTALVTIGALASLPAQAAAPSDNGSPGIQTTFAPEGATPSAAPSAAPVPAGATTGTSRDVALARGNRASRDLFGWQPSLYQGRWFEAGVEPIRRCIMDRESNFNYTAVGAGTYFGAYQMNRGLANGATAVMEDEVRKEMGAEGVAILRALRDITPNRWNRYWQDRAFYTVWAHGDGKGNWRGGGLNCF